MHLHVEIAPVQEVVGELLRRAEDAVEEVLMVDKLFSLLVSSGLPDRSVLARGQPVP